MPAPLFTWGAWADGDGAPAGEGFDGVARRHVPQQRQLGGSRLPLGRGNLDPAALVMIAVDVAFALEVGEVFVHRGERLETELAGDLLETRGIAVVGDVARDVVENLMLTARERHWVSRKYPEP